MAAVAACAAVAAALTALPAGAAAPQPGPGGQAAPGGPATTITLITGDRVVTSGGPDGTLRVIRAEGRDDIGFRIARGTGGTYVIPSDAERLVAEGTLDRRLFDVTELSRAPYREADGLPLIVTYDGERPATLRAADVRADLPAIDGEALTVAPGEAAALWEQLTGPRTLASGIETVALDGIVTKTLAESVPQIGAPEAWEAGYDGTGVTIAVLDTGISSTHPDVADHVVAAENFSDSEDTEDRDGHGTHVASTATGTGAQSGGTYTGVAPGADLINAKVLDDYGYGWDSDIVEGMQWAVDQGADIVSMSLGGTATPGLDLLEEAVDSLSASSDTLFVVASGNEGPDAGTVGSPGTAASALTVGAVDKQDVLAEFSSAGPTVGDGFVKPDVTAPGVDIAAAGAEGAAIWDYGTPVTDGYVALNGTSMATPHVSGAAALLAQAHPDWDGEQIKAALTSSAVSTGDYSPFQQGTGRIDVPAALAQNVIAEPGALNFGVVPYPHDDAEPVTRDLTYRNLGDTDVTLDLTTEATGPGGNPAPEGLFTLATDTVTVPAGGTATVQVTADTSTGDAYGAYGLTVTATGGDGTTVRTVGGVEREAEHAELTLTATGRDGEPSADWLATVWDLTTGEPLFAGPEEDGTATLRLPVGDYALDNITDIWDPETGDLLGSDFLSMPHLALTEDTAVDFDSADTRPVDVSLAADGAELSVLTVGYSAATEGDAGIGLSASTGDLPEGFRSGTVGEPAPGWEPSTHMAAEWAGEGVQFHTADVRPTTLYDGLTRHVARRDLARVTTTLGSPEAGGDGMLSAGIDGIPQLSDLSYAVPGAVEVWLDATSGPWRQSYAAFSASGGMGGHFLSGLRSYAPRERTRAAFGVGVFGTSVDPAAGEGVQRVGDTLSVTIPALNDGGGNAYSSWAAEERVTLYRDGEEYATSDYTLEWTTFEVPADEAEYELVATVDQGEPGAVLSSRVTSAWTFTSARPAGDEPVSLPVSAVRFLPRLAPDSTAPADGTFRVPVTVEGSAAGETPAVEVSYDSGETWEDVRVRNGKVKVTNPEAGGTVSFRATVTDEDGNTSTQTVIDAYRTK
ncbi:S8 family serine peptidase [Streptomyces sp. NPDC049879]|uniref:S8 family serine peptidase n=1 Tax=Streptomyces sp. NPDC049879 TaxID=3365598 RepID=UPI00378B95AF